MNTRYDSFYNSLALDDRKTEEIIRRAVNMKQKNERIKGFAPLMAFASIALVVTLGFGIYFTAFSEFGVFGQRDGEDDDIPAIVSDDEPDIEDFLPPHSDPTGKIIININTFSDELRDNILRQFLAENPEFFEKYYLQFNVIVEDSKYIIDVNDRLNQGAADIFLMDINHIQSIINNPGIAALSDLGMNINEDDYFNYTLDLMRVNDELMGLPVHTCPGTVFYRADYASEYLGINSPEEMTAAISTWDGLIETAKRLHENSGGEISMVYSVDEFIQSMLAARTAPWIKDGELVPEEELLRQCYDVARELYDNGLIASYEGRWSVSWFDEMRDGGVFMYFGTTWFHDYVIKHTACGDDHHVVYNDPEHDCTGNGSYGLWAMALPPEPFFWGGTFVGVSKTAVNDPEKNQAIAQLIEWISNNSASAGTDFFAFSNKSDTDRVNESEFLGGQNAYTVFAQAAENIENLVIFDEYDNRFVEVVLEAIAEGWSFEEMMERFNMIVEYGHDILLT
ncbi:MAG: ABC transporter substrate-binding protein [Oscillospiraceae bacterium]|nr:ABC transporter substrate-binding protein [Oscillospiraceae bacterium]